MAYLLTILLLVVIAFQPTVEAYNQYQVQPGDTLYDIAKEYGLPWQDLANYNDISDPSRMRAGITLYIPGLTPPELDFTNRVGSVGDVSREERMLLARLITAEARGESLNGQIAVGAVVVNRVKSSLFPGTLWDVIYQPRQFTPVEADNLPISPTSSSIEAARRALAGEDPTGGALFFYNPNITQTPEFWESRPVIKRIGNHNFAI